MLLSRLVFSGNIVSGQVGHPHVSSGAIGSGQLNTTGTPNGTLFLRDDFSWNTPAFSITSGQIGSGLIASGAVDGFFGPSRRIQSGTVGVFDFGSGAVVAGATGSGCIVSAAIASGQVGTFHLRSGIIQSGFWVGSGSIWGQAGVNQFCIASGTITTNDLGSGAITSTLVASGQIGTFALSSGIIKSGFWVGSGSIWGQAGVNQFCIASGTITTNDLGSGAIVSSLVASGQIGTFALASGSIRSGFWVASGSIFGQAGPNQFCIASGTIGTFDIGSGAIQSGRVASGQIGQFHLASGSILSGFWVGSGSIWGQAGVNQFCIASGTIATFDIGSGAIVSGRIASGQLGQYHHGSGVIVPDAAFGVPLQSGIGAWGGITTSVITAFNISGVRAVSLNLSGQLQIANASQSGTMPAIGVVLDNVASGISANVYTFGAFQLSSGILNASGYLGQAIFVGRSGQLVTVSGWFNSGGLLSGDITQPIGVAVNSGAVMLGAASVLPFVLAQVTSGNIASGQIWTYHFASGAAAPISESVCVYISGGINTVVTAEMISGVRAVCYNQSGQLIQAMAAVSGRMPAIGVVIDNVASGLNANVYAEGFIQVTSGMDNFSGYLQQPCWVGRSGQLVQVSGSWTSAAFASGDLGQKLGVIANSGAVMLNVMLIVYSGGPLGGGLGGVI